MANESDTKGLERRKQLHQTLVRGVVTEPLLTHITEAPPDTPFDIIISLNELFPNGLDRAAEWVERALKALDPPVTSKRTANYLFATVPGAQINRVPLINSHGDVTGPAITWAFATLVAGV